MSDNYAAKPKLAPAITRPGESKEYVGSRNITSLLPAIFQTTVNKQFLQTTLEQLLSSGSLQAINHYVGQKNKNTIATDNYHTTTDRLAESYQFVPAAINKDNNNNITNALSYDDLLNSLTFNEVQSTNHNRVFNEKGYTLDLPINYDMLVNYHRYFWLVDFLPAAEIKPTSAQPMVIDDIVGEVYYTTPTLSTGNSLTLENGMRIKFSPSVTDSFEQTVSGNTTFTTTVSSAIETKVYVNKVLQTSGTDYTLSGTTLTFSSAPVVTALIEADHYYASGTSYDVSNTYIVDGVGDTTGIKLTLQLEANETKDYYGRRRWFNQTIYSGEVPSPWDPDGSIFEDTPFDVREIKMPIREYTCEQRWSTDQSAWARSNLWMHEETAKSVCEFMGLDQSLYLIEEFRAVRPIIEYRANLEKYDFGLRQIEYVDHVFSTIQDPAADIVGKTEWNLASYTITDAWTSTGYNRGDRVKYTLAGQTTYWDCIQTHTEGKDPSYYANRVFWRQVTAMDLEDGDTVLFLNADTAYNNKIFTVSGISTGSIILTEKFNFTGVGATQIQTGDKIVCKVGYNSVFLDTYDGDIYSGSEWYWNGSAWIYGQQKDHRSEGALFQLYDTDLQKLDNDTVYPNSNFRGDRIFDFGKSSSKYDDALGFSPRYIDYGNTPGISFDIELGAKKYSYNILGTDSVVDINNDVSTIVEIPGFYYYKDTVTGRYKNGWAEIRNGQPVRQTVRTIISNSTNSAIVNLQTDDTYLNDKFNFVLRNNNLSVSEESTRNSKNRIVDVNGTNPVMFMSKGKTYTLQTYFDNTDLEFVNIDGTALSGITRSAATNNVFTLDINSSVTIDVFRYRLASDNTVTGLVYLNNSDVDRNIKVFVNGIETTNYTLSNNVVTVFDNLVIDDVVSVEWYTDDTASVQSTFDVADTHMLNAQNKWLTEVSFGDILAHIKSQMESLPGFSGNFFGTNNYRNLPHVHEFGGTIRQQPYSTELLSQTMMDNDTNIFSSVRYISQDYRKFKNQFLQKVIQLHNKLDINIPVHELVDRALSDINLGKRIGMPHSNSNMAVYRDYESVEYTFISTDTKVFDLPKSVNTYNDTSNHIQVWLEDRDAISGNTRWKPLINGINYTISNNKITVVGPITYTTSGSAKIHVRWYPLNSPSFVPPSAAKLGLVRPCIPELRGDYSLSNNAVNTDSVIVGHDGSITARSGNEIYDRTQAGFSITDAALWDLELRIYNNIHEGTDEVVDFKEILPNANRATPYTWDDLTLALESEFNKWKVRNNITSLDQQSYYDGSDPFTWNYNSVAPFIGGWRGIYTYYFNTDKPHTHPWEMFGYNKKPDWWDANYSWTDAPKRAALIQALTNGHYNNPSETPKYNINYAYTSYDWTSDTLVTLAGNLNNPITANVVSTPTINDRQDEFVFGDIGPIESEWRRTSEYTTSLFCALLRLRPLWVINNYFRSIVRKIKDNSNYNNPVILFDDTKELGNNTTPQFSYSRYEDSIVESIIVTNGGSGYTSAPNIEVLSNFGNGTTATAYITGDKVTSVSITAPGKNYYSKPSVTADTGNAKFEAVLQSDAIKYFAGLSNAVVEFSIFNKTTVADLESRFANLSMQPVVKVGGFLNPNNQKFILESSQGKGRVIIPEEDYSNILHLNYPELETFYSAIKVIKEDSSYIVSGYDNSNNYFKFLQPRTGGKKKVITVKTKQVNRYLTHDSIPYNKDYNSRFESLQELFNFIIGYGEYLKQQGWNVDWDSQAADCVSWAINANTNDVFVVNPAASEIEIYETGFGYFDNLTNKYDGVYNIIDKNGRQLLHNKVIVTREYLDTETPFTKIVVKNPEDEIRGLRLYKVNLEHMIVFDNETSFDDVLYKPELGQAHRRLIWKGSKTKAWNGRLYSPGYIVNDNSIINNFDTVAREMDLYYGPGNTINNKQIVDAARFNQGYNKPVWSSYTMLDDDTVFEFTKGSLKYKGTRFALDAFSRNKDLLGDINSIDLYEEWAIRTADYGDLRNKETIEFEITEDLIKTSPQPIRFTAGEIFDELTDLVIDIDTNSPLLVSGTPGDNFETRPVKTYAYSTISDETVFANDLVTAGLPLLTETDYRVINRDDFRVFPEETKVAYNFSGEWKEIKQWDSKTAYKYKDKVIYQGKVWEMLDPDGTSGLTKPNDPIIINGTITLPVVPAAGQTLILDGNTVNVNKTSTSTTFDLITVVGTNDIGSSTIVPHGSTLILGSAADGSNAQTITFENTTSTVVFQTIEETFDSVVDPVIVGGTSKTLIIDGVTINFNDTTSNTTAITAFTALSSVISSALSTNRINAIEALRTAYIAASSSGAWDTFITAYFTNNAGLDVDYLITEYNTTPSYQPQLETLITNDVSIINSLAGTSYVIADVISGATTVDPADIATAQSAMNAGSYIDDLAEWIKDNPTTALVTSTVVATQTTTSFTNYSLTDIINKINSASIPLVTATSDNNSLTLQKTTLTPSVQFSLVIGPGTANNEVGFNSGTTRFNSVGSVVTTTPALNISQVINQINAASLPGISAQAYPADSNRLQINSSNSVLYIGNGTANVYIGLTQGVIPATSTITTTTATSDITDIIQSINDANITGISASNSNNRLRITSTNPTLTIGSGTANNTVGLTAGVYEATQSVISNIFDALGSDGNPVFREVVNDPNLFSIWVADNSTQTSANLGYAVFQTMDFDMYITRACAGIDDADDAEITIALADTTTQAHNLQKGDYVLIRGSNTVPSIDGIHQVSAVDQNSQIKFYIDEYIEKEGNAGNIYPVRNVRFSNYAELVAALSEITNGMYRYNFAGSRLSDTQHPIYAFVDSDDTGVPAVYKYSGIYSNNSGHTSIAGWQKVRQTIRQSRNDLLKNVKLYDAEQRTIITTLPVFDPAKGIIPGFIENEIDFKTTADIANYNYSNIDGFTENNRAWGNEQLGQRWWDLTTAIYLDYEQGSLDYQQANWGRLFSGAEVDVYEWTRSPVTPDQWTDLVANGKVIDGVAVSGTPYSKVIDGETVYQWTEEVYYDVKTKNTKTGYYFWVKDKTTFSGLRNYNTYQLARIIENPLLADFSWCAASGNNGLLLSNIQNYITENTVVQVNKSFDHDNTLELCEYTLVSETDPDSFVPEYLHIKIRDSLAGFNNYSRTYNYTNYSASTSYNQNQVVQEGSDFYISLTDSNIGNTPSLDTTQSNWRKIYDYSLPDDTPQDDIKIIMSQPVPDLRLHEYNRYGHLVRPVQSLYRDIVSARQNFVDTLNKIFGDICAFNEFSNWENYFDNTFIEGTSTYDLNRYWKYVDYTRKEYSSSGALIYTYDKENVPDRVFNNHYELVQASFGLGIVDPGYTIGELALVKNVIHGDKINRPEVYSWDGENWILEFKAKGTIEFSEEIWNQSKFGHGFDVVGFDTTGFDSDSSIVIAKMFDLLRNNIFVGKHKNKYKTLWFQCLYQAVTDNTTDDFAFKTTYTKMKIDRPLLIDKVHYNNYSIRAIEEFYNDIKPFHTKLRTILDRNTYLEDSDIEVTEIDRNIEITLAYNDHSGRSFSGDLILDGGTFLAEILNIDESEFTTLDSSLEYIYNGNEFVQPSLEGWGEELYPIDFSENIRIGVQTNLSNSIETSDTRTFYMNYWTQYNLEENIVVVENSSTTVNGTISPSDTEITVSNGLVLTTPTTENGVVWINNERIEYGAIDGNTLKYCLRGTRGTTATSHSNLDKVIDASSAYRIPTPDNFYLYGDSLLPAYNDSGVSLATAGTGTEHSFIRSAGYGTL